MKAFLFIKNAWLVPGITIAMIFGVEIVSYVVLKGYLLATSPVDSRSQAAGYEDRGWAVRYFKELASLPGFGWQSFVHWRQLPFQGQFINIDTEGRRRTWKAMPESDSKLPRVRIFMMGGSAMWGTGARDEETIPSIVAQLLTREHKLNVEVTNFGESGYVSTQEVITLLRELQRENTPDLVIFYDGVNDSFGAYQNRGVAGLPHNEANRKREFNLLRPGHIRRLYREGLLVTFQSSSTYHVLRAAVRWTTGRDPFRVDSDRFVSRPPDETASEVARVYAWNMKLARDLGQLHGFKTLFYWQPAVFTKDRLTPDEQRVRDKGRGTESYYNAATHAVRTRLASVESFHDISGVFRGNPRPYFIDEVHVTGAGNEVIARRMLKDIVPVVQAWRTRSRTPAALIPRRSAS